jgi:hypothetical protein
MAMPPARPEKGKPLEAPGSPVRNDKWLPTCTVFEWPLLIADRRSGHRGLRLTETGRHEFLIILDSRRRRLDRIL